MHGVLFPVVFAPEHRRILLIHYSILYQIVLVRFNVSILKQVDVHLVKVNEQIHDPASSKWPFDHPNGGHLTLEKVT